jgi:hypothetical protein
VDGFRQQQLHRIRICEINVAQGSSLVRASFKPPVVIQFKANKAISLSLWNGGMPNHDRRLLIWIERL